MRKLLFLFSFVAMLTLAWHGANAGPPDDVATSIEVVCLSVNQVSPDAIYDYCLVPATGIMYESPAGIYIVQAGELHSHYSYIYQDCHIKPPDSCTTLVNNYKSYVMPFDRIRLRPLHFV